MLPILHLNGFKIHNPTILSRISHGELESFFRGCGWEPRFVEGDDPKTMHQTMAAALDWAIREIKRIQANARTTGDDSRPTWPMIVLRSPKEMCIRDRLSSSWRWWGWDMSMGT